MRLKKEIALIKEKLDKITNDTLNKAKEYDFVMEKLKNINIQIKYITKFIDDYGKIGLKITYHIPTVSVILDDNNDIVKEETFYTINILNLLSIEDEKKLILAIDEIKHLNNIK